MTYANLDPGLFCPDLSPDEKLQFERFDRRVAIAFSLGLLMILLSWYFRFD